MARDAGALAGLRPADRTPKRTAEHTEIDRLRARAERAEADLARTRAALEVVGKTHPLLEMLSERPACGARAARPAPGAAERAYRCRAPASLGGAERPSVRRQVRRAGVGDAAGRGRLPGVDVHHAPGAARRRPGRRAAPAGHPPPRTKRRRQATHPPGTKPELLATGPGQVWSWDITKLRGPARGQYFDLYVILGIYSRCVVGWTVAATEDSQIAKDLLAQAIGEHGRPGSIHADRGTSLTSKPVAQLLGDLGVARSHSRPHLSNDNPYSEAAFKTLKYAPLFPDRFGCQQGARSFCQAFFAYYNGEYRHSGIGLHTPASVHSGTVDEIRAQRAATLDGAYAAAPARFRHRPPRPPALPHAAWINQPQREALVQSN